MGGHNIATLEIRRCLTKNPRQRLRDIGDARLAIEDCRSKKLCRNNAFKKQNGNPEAGLRIPVRLLLSTRGARHWWAGVRRATRATSAFVSILAIRAISFSPGDFKSRLPPMDPAAPPCETK